MQELSPAALLLLLPPRYLDLSAASVHGAPSWLSVGAVVLAGLAFYYASGGGTRSGGAQLQGEPLPFPGLHGARSSGQGEPRPRWRLCMPQPTVQLQGPAEPYRGPKQTTTAKGCNSSANPPHPTLPARPSAGEGLNIPCTSSACAVGFHAALPTDRSPATARHYSSIICGFRHPVSERDAWVERTRGERGGWQGVFYASRTDLVPQQACSPLPRPHRMPSSSPLFASSHMHRAHAHTDHARSPLPQRGGCRAHVSSSS